MFTLWYAKAYHTHGTFPGFLIIYPVYWTICRHPYSTHTVPIQYVHSTYVESTQNPRSTYETPIRP